MKTTRAVYGSSYLAIYIRKDELDKLLDGEFMELDLYAEASLIAPLGVGVFLMEPGLAALKLVVRAERRAYGKGRTSWKRFPP